MLQIYQAAESNPLLEPPAPSASAPQQSGGDGDGGEGESSWDRQSLRPLRPMETQGAVDRAAAAEGRNATGSDGMEGRRAEGHMQSPTWPSPARTPEPTALKGSDLSPDPMPNTSDCISDEFAKFDRLLGKLKASRQHMSPFQVRGSADTEECAAASCHSPLEHVERTVLDCNPADRETASEDEFAKLDRLLLRLRETRASLASIQTVQYRDGPSSLGRLSSDDYRLLG